MSNPLFQGRRLRSIARTGIGESYATPPTASLYRERIIYNGYTVRLFPNRIPNRPLLAQSGGFASEPEAVALDRALRFESSPTAGRLWCAYVAPHVSVDCYRPVAAAGRRAGCAGS